MPPEKRQILVTEDMAAYHSGCPGSTIRRWAAEGRIKRYGSGRGKVRYNVPELPLAVRDEFTGEILWREPPPPLPGRELQPAPRAA